MEPLNHRLLLKVMVEWYERLIEADQPYRYIVDTHKEIEKLQTLSRFEVSVVNPPRKQTQTKRFVVDGTEVIYSFSNGYGARVTNTKDSWGRELELLIFHADDPTIFRPCKTTAINGQDDDGVCYLTLEDVEEYLEKIALL